MYLDVHTKQKEEKQMKTKGLVVFIVLCIISLLVISTASAKSIELRFNYSMPLKKSIAKSWHWYGDEVEKQTNGKVKFQYFPLGGLFKCSFSR